MAKGNFQNCLNVTLAHEGGWSDHPSDPGGATMKGVTIGRYREYYPDATKDDLRRISDYDLNRIYHADYWTAVRADDLTYGVDLAAFDFGVNSGPGRAVRYLQAVLGVTQDGAVGPNTLKASIMADGKATIQKLCAKRLSFLQGLSTFSVFGKGWSRRIADVEARAVVMWLAKGAALTAAMRADLQAEADKAAKASKAQGSAAGGAGGGVAVGGVQLPEHGWMLVAGIVLLLGVVVVLAVKARQNKARSLAYAQAAA